MQWALLVVLDVFVKFLELCRLENAETNDGDDSENEGIHAPKDKILRLKVSTYDTAEGVTDILCSNTRANTLTLTDSDGSFI